MSNLPLSIGIIHFIGIGGIGMSGIAELMFDLGYSVQGSDIGINENIIRLKNKGIKIYNKHNAKNIKKISVAVFSSAIKKNNIEIVACNRLSIPVVSRADMLAELRLKLSYFAPKILILGGGQVSFREIQVRFEKIRGVQVKWFQVMYPPPTAGRRPENVGILLGICWDFGILRNLKQDKIL